MGDLAAIDALGQDVVWHLFAVFLRVGAMMTSLPAFGEQSVPPRVKLGLAMAFTAIVAPALPTIGVPTGALGALAVGMAEVLTGLFMGLMLRLFVITLQVAGSVAAQSTSLSQLFGGAGTDPLPAMGHVLVVGGLALATIMGLHVQIAKFMLFSYELVPVGEVIPSQMLSQAGIAEVSRAFALGFSLAAPFVIASLIYNVTLGVINKAMPQLMVAFVGAPAITAGGLILLMLSTPFMLSFWVDALGAFMLDPFRGPR